VSPRQRSQEKEAFLAFYDATFAESYRYAGRLCGDDRGAAEDLVQEAYLNVLRRFRDGSADVLTIAYLVTTIRHRYLDGIRHDDRETRRLRLIVSDVGDVADVSDVAVSTPLHRLADLPQRERAALVLRYVDDLAVPDVAASLQLSVHATESLLARARTRLRGREARDA
jgi:RNA polymerase sigma-70 factor (ECF subfamily)